MVLVIQKAMHIIQGILLDWFFQRVSPEKEILADLVREILDYSNAATSR